MRRSVYIAGIYLLFIIVGSVFLVELGIMLLVPLAPFDASPLTIALFDGLLLSALLFPVLYLFAYRPMVEEISRRRLVEKDLSRSERYLRSVIDSEPECVKLLDETGALLDMNPAGLEMIDADSLNQVKGQNVYGLVDAQHRDAFRALTERVCRGERGTLEFRMTGLKGRSLWLETHAVPFQDDRHGKTFLLGITRDVTERKLSEEQLRRSEERFRSLFDHAADAIFLVHGDGRFLDANRSACESLGHTREQIISLSLDDIVVDFSLERFSKVFQSLLDGSDPISLEGTHRRADGTTFPVEVRAGLIRIRDEPLILAIARDVSMRRRLEEERENLEKQLRHSQKMEAVGTLAGGIAHDFNNILSAIMGYTELVLLDLPEEGTHREYLGEVLDATVRARNIVQQILAFSRQTEGEKKPLLIQFLLKESVKFLRASLPSTIDIREEIDSRCGMVMADAGQISQVIMNLCTNAAHSMEEGGTLTVGLSPDDLQAADAPSAETGEGTSYIRLWISDTGSGMSAETLDRAFEPYFTTKDPSIGTGLGLSVVHGIVQDHGGFFRVESAPGRGSTFSAYFPRILGEGETAHESGDPLPRGDERVLFVDDEASIARLGKSLLEGLGYRATSFDGSREALEAIRRGAGEFDLVVSDLTMPLLTGADLVREIGKVRDDLPIIICTGYGELIDRRMFEGTAVRSFLYKPLTRRKLAVAVREALDSPS